MKKILSLFLVFFLIASNLFAGTLEMDWMEGYSTNALAQAAYVTSGGGGIYAQQTTNEDSERLGDSANSERRLRQSFTLNETQTITSLKITFNASSGSPSGQVTCRIETDNGSDQASGTLAHANATLAFTPTASAENTIDYTDFELAATKYWIVLNCDNQTTSVYWTVAIKVTDGYAGGHAAATYDGVWTDLSPEDLTFKVYTLVLQCYSEATIKTQGTYSLKGIAAITNSLNETLTKTFAVNSNLSGVKNLWFDTRASRTGSNIKLGLHDTGGTTTEITPNIITADTYQKVNWDWSGVSDANKDVIDTLTVTITNADVANTFYYDYAEIAQAIDVFGFIN